MIVWQIYYLKFCVLREENKMRKESESKICWKLKLHILIKSTYLIEEILF